MKTSTFLRRAIRSASFLTIFLVLISFTNEKPVSEKSIGYKEVVQPKDVDVLLRIDTNGINDGNLDSKIIFVNVGDTTSTGSGNPKEFLTVVYKNKKISWRGEPQDPNSNAIIEILNIERKSQGGAKLLKFSSKTNKNKGVQIKVKDRKIEGLEYYLVKFSISEGDEVRIFEVDPKLEMGG